MLHCLTDFLLDRCEEVIKMVVNPDPVDILKVASNIVVNFFNHASFFGKSSKKHYLYLIDEITHKVKYYHTLAHLTGHSCTDCDLFWTV